ncbi:MAG: NAD-dependent epimerase/dehydratase family protein [Verrucomicrobia bacterium]|nr:NAD-dependent epimerase/dehydratase family protein [Verrucomicrobiota bacterium]
MSALAAESGRRLVVFGAGYVGGEFARQAIARGLRVTALTRNEAKARDLRTAGAEVVVADLADESWHAAIPGGANLVLNTVSGGGGGLDGYRHSYLAGMRSIIEWSRARGSAGVLVYTSSTSVYPHDGGVRVDEDSPATPRDDRAAVLVETEALLRGAAPAARTFVLRLAGIYGPGRHYLIDQVRGGEVAGVEEHHLNLAHRDDICSAIWAAMESAPALAGGLFNVADNAPARKGEVARWIAAQLDLPAPRFTGLPAGGRRAVVPDRIIVNARLRRALGWEPRYPSYREGLAPLLGDPTA